jgi:hypothetical protein
LTLYFQREGRKELLKEVREAQVRKKEQKSKSARGGQEMPRDGMFYRTYELK